VQESGIPFALREKVIQSKVSTSCFWLDVMEAKSAESFARLSPLRPPANLDRLRIRLLNGLKLKKIEMLCGEDPQPMTLSANDKMQITWNNKFGRLAD